MCHMYLQVTTLAEIMDHMGTQLLPQALPDTNLISVPSTKSASPYYNGLKSTAPPQSAGNSGCPLFRKSLQVPPKVIVYS